MAQFKYSGEEKILQISFLQKNENIQKQMWEGNWSLKPQY